MVARSIRFSGSSDVDSRGFVTDVSDICWLKIWLTH